MRTFVVRILLSTSCLVLLRIDACQATMASTSDVLSPSTLNTLQKDLEKVGLSTCRTAALLTSQSVAPSDRKELATELLGEGPIQSKVAASDSGMVVLQPESLPELVISTRAAHTLLYYADPIDLRRGEGLFGLLGPSLEQAASTQSIKKNLVVITENKQVTQARLEDLLARQVLPHMVQPASSLNDVFDQVEYLSVSQAQQHLVESPLSTLASESAPSTLSRTATTGLSGENLAAARTMGPEARRQLDRLLRQVVGAVRTPEPTLVPAFGDLCQSILLKSSQSLDSSKNKAPSTTVAQALQNNLKQSLEANLLELLDEQLDLLEAACFESFKKDLSKLLVSPNLESDMIQCVSKTVSTFGKRGSKVIFGAGGSGTLKARQVSLRHRLTEYVQRRVQAARASGKFRPLPRKGVTVGLHWLLPKPFGNDYRQEPWMTHATDSLVYVPPDQKVTDVSPEDVASGTWRDKIVPSPSGNDMLYMQ